MQIQLRTCVDAAPPGRELPAGQQGRWCHFLCDAQAECSAHDVRTAAAVGSLHVAAVPSPAAPLCRASGVFSAHSGGHVPGVHYFSPSEGCDQPRAGIECFYWLCESGTTDLRDLVLVYLNAASLRAGT